MNQELADHIENRIKEIHEDIEHFTKRLEETKTKLSQAKAENLLSYDTYLHDKAMVEAFERLLREHQMELDIFYTARDTKSES